MGESISRKSFLTAAGMAVAGLAASGIAFAEESKPVDATDVVWDAEYDVVVAGYGAGGANAAINAAEAGAKVLLTEKCPEGEEGGNTKYSGQGLQCFTDIDQAKTYYRSLRGFWNTPSDAVIDAYADAIADMRDYVIWLGVENTDNLDNYQGKGTPWLSKGEFPELAGAGYMLYYCVSGKSFDGAYYALLQENVNKRSDMIDVWFDAPAVHLIQEPETKIIRGIQVEKDGAKVNVRAKNGVVLATGGFENNQDMIQNYLQQPYMVPFGATHNTGDGIKMALEVDANLWHMSNMAGPLWTFVPPESERGVMGTNCTLGIMVGPNGTRFTNEAQSNRHGRINYGGRYQSREAPLPAYEICDADSMAENKVLRMFSDGNVEEIAAGYFISGETIEELADNIAAALPPEVAMPNAATSFQENLIAEVAKWNEFCEAGADPRFERPADGMRPIKQGPFYGIKLDIMMYNTQGGPEKNERGEIIDRDGNPIPHLYSAGELGALWADAYNGGGNLGECTAFGRISGKNAAEPKND